MPHQGSRGKEFGDGQVAGLEARGWDPVLLGGAGVITPGGDLGAEAGIWAPDKVKDVARAIQVHRTRGLAVGTKFIPLHADTDPHAQELKNNTLNHTVSAPHLPWRHRKTLG